MFVCILEGKGQNSLKPRKFYLGTPIFSLQFIFILSLEINVYKVPRNKCLFLLQIF